MRRILQMSMSVVVMLAAFTTATAQNAVLPAADELHIAKSDDSVPSTAKNSYMRITLDREVKAGKWTLLVLPSELDGYYFGPNAPRYEVSQYDDSAPVPAVTGVKMADAKDFQPNHVYLLKSDGDVSEIVCKSPGVPTKVEQTASQQLLVCLEFDDVNINPTGIEQQQIPSDPATHDTIFDIIGRAVKKAVHGIYIINGKKVFVK